MAGADERGPWGGNGGASRDMGIANHILSIKIDYIDAIWALDVVYTVGDYGGKKKTFHMGGSGGTPVVLELEEDEHITHISGQFHNKWGENVFVTQLSLGTNKGIHSSQSHACMHACMVKQEELLRATATAS